MLRPSPNPSAAAAAAALLAARPQRAASLPAPPALAKAARVWEARARFTGAGAAVVGAPPRGAPPAASGAFFPPFLAGAIGAPRPRLPLSARPPGVRLQATPLQRLGGGPFARK